MNRVSSVNKVFLATVITSILGSFVRGWILKFTNNYFVLLMTSQIIIALPSIFYLVANKIKIRNALCFKKIRISDIILIVVFSYLITPLMTLINAISMLFVENTTSDYMSNVVENNGLLLSLFIIAIIPAIFEESVYRGIFYNEYRKVNPLKAILLSGFLFGIIHLNVNQFSYAFIMGIVFALLIEATDSILSTMIVHFFINGTSVFTVYIFPKILNLLDSISSTEQFNVQDYRNALEVNMDEILSFRFIIKSYLLPALISTILAFIVYRTIAKNSGRWEHIKEIFKGKTVRGEYPANYGYPDKLSTFPLIVGIVICVFLMVLFEVYA